MPYPHDASLHFENRYGNIIKYIENPHVGTGPLCYDTEFCRGGIPYIPESGHGRFDRKGLAVCYKRIWRLVYDRLMVLRTLLEASYMKEEANMWEKITVFARWNETDFFLSVKVDRNENDCWFQSGALVRDATGRAVVDLI